MGALEASADIQPKVTLGAAQELGCMDLRTRPEAIKGVQLGTHAHKPKAGRIPMLMGHEEGAEDKEARGGAGSA